MSRAVTVVVALCLAAAVIPAVAGGTTTTRSVAQSYAHRTFIAQNGSHRAFKLAGPGRFATASDGSTIAAFGIVIADSGDGSGQAVLLFRNGRFLGWASAFDTLALAVSSNGSAIKVRYGDYKGNDPSCCPSSFKTILYRWTGSKIVASGTPPLIYGKQGSRLHLS